MNRKLGMAAASILMGAAAAVAVPATAQAAPAATWQPTGQYYSTSSRCMADADYYLAASNVYDYKCVKSGSLYKGMVYAD
ncbi:hypothetical protein [Streptomyces sp. NBRC 110028]|uniref:hypothetical protein n=1 Tax=Streptomyces sp. NBRC 110028 TaxID=1621260 RepID=UPI0006E3DCCC|nr:hypothetical protein [Streptomyces sp. NBRC 110028]